MADRHVRWRVLALALPLLVAVVVAVLALRSSGGDDPTSGASVDLDAQDAVAVSSVAELVDAAQCSFTGEVVVTQRGRAVAPGLVSRLVTIRVDEGLAGDCPSGTVVLEEEGWIDDGAEVTVNGWPGSATGDRGVWFLVAGASDEAPYAATVTSSGALRWRDGRPLVPPDPPDWVATATADGPEQLAEQVRSLG